MEYDTGMLKNIVVVCPACNGTRSVATPNGIRFCTACKGTGVKVM
jgi:DnaJ-class molecular chaperone